MGGNLALCLLLGVGLRLAIREETTVVKELPHPGFVLRLFVRRAEHVGTLRAFVDILTLDAEKGDMAACAGPPMLERVVVIVLVFHHSLDLPQGTVDIL